MEFLVWCIILLLFLNIKSALFQFAITFLRVLISIPGYWVGKYFFVYLLHK